MLKVKECARPNGILFGEATTVTSGRASVGGADAVGSGAPRRSGVRPNFGASALGRAVQVALCTVGAGSGTWAPARRCRSRAACGRTGLLHLGILQGCLPLGAYFLYEFDKGLGGGPGVNA